MARPVPHLLRLRYRPASDILSGSVDLDGLHVLETTAVHLDADTSIDWARVVDPASDCPDPTDTSAAIEVLSSFHVVHAAALRRASALPRLPPDVLGQVTRLIDSGSSVLRADASTLERVQARAEVSVALALRQLRRPDEGVVYAPPEWSADDDSRRRATTSLRRFSSALGKAPTSNSLGTERTDRAARLVDELASVLEMSDGLSSPGASAAAAQAIRGGLPLSLDEQASLRSTLSDFRRNDSWRLVADRLDSVSEALEGDRPAP